MWLRTVVLVLTLAACTSDASGTSLTNEVTAPSTTLATTSTTVAETASTTTTAVAEATTTTAPLLAAASLTVEAFPVPAGSRPHDVAPAIDGGVWYTAQNLGELGWLDPATGETLHTDLGEGSRPHGVIVDGDGVPWITDSGLNAIVSVDPATFEVAVYPLPAEHPDANLNTASFANDGTLWFTGQNGIYGHLDPVSGSMEVFDAPGGRGPYGITTTPQGSIYYASLAGSHVGAIDPSGAAAVVEPPSPDQGARRVWSDSSGAVWVSEWNTGNLSRYQPETETWDTWPLPGDDAAAYAVFVDDADIVWVSDFGSNSVVRFDPVSESFTVLALPHDPGDVRQILGRFGEVWGAESAADHLVLIRTR
jgi:virginiamycin B lyase